MDDLEGPGLTPEQKEEMAKRAREMRDSIDPNKPAPKSGLEKAVEDKRSIKLTPREDNPDYKPFKPGDPLEAVDVNPDFSLGPKKDKKKQSKQSIQDKASKRFILDRKTLDDYVRANGNMSVARRSSVVAYALRHLGYSSQDAKEIALDAPLNAGMYNDGAIKSALEYAETLDSKSGHGRRDAIRSALYAGAVDMPEAARQALAQARANSKTITRKTQENVFGRLANISRIVSSGVKPVSDRMGNLPVPGGIGGLLAINLVFLAAIVPAHPQGYTRLELLWLTMMNRTKLPESVSVKEAPASPLVQAAMSLAEGIQETAVAVGSLGNSASKISDIVGAAGSNPVTQAIARGFVGGLLTQGQSYVPPSNTGSTPPPPAMPPTQPGTVTL